MVTFHDLPDTSTPLNATNLNGNFSELNNKFNYATSEAVVGTYKGKPLYRKVVEFTTNATVNAWTNASCGISNLKDMVRIDGIIDTSDNYAQHIASLLTYDFMYRRDNSTLIMKISNSAYTNKPCRVELEYTKTTD